MYNATASLNLGLLWIHLSLSLVFLESLCLLNTTLLLQMVRINRSPFSKILHSVRSNLYHQYLRRLIHKFLCLTQKLNVPQILKTSLENSAHSSTQISFWQFERSLVITLLPSAEKSIVCMQSSNYWIHVSIWYRKHTCAQKISTKTSRMPLLKESIRSDLALNPSFLSLPSTTRMNSSNLTTQLNPFL